MSYLVYKNEFAEKGYAIVHDMFTETEISAIISVINSSDQNGDVFRKTKGLFAIRQALKQIPALQPLITKQELQDLIFEIFGQGYFVVKSIYFDKPGDSNWFVAYHQDLTISVNTKAAVEGFGPWTVKQNQFAVQPPLEMLERNFTIRVHLDDTDESNGALRVIPGSHKKGIYRPETINWDIETEEYCEVKKGGIMIMSPLLLHASNRTIDKRQRRVLHIEFSSDKLPEPLHWSEAIVR